MSAVLSYSPLFRAQFRENRTIFNTPNPRLMNVSLMKDSKYPSILIKHRMNLSTCTVRRACVALVKDDES